MPLGILHAARVLDTADSVEPVSPSVPLPRHIQVKSSTRRFFEEKRSVERIHCADHKGLEYAEHLGHATSVLPVVSTLTFALAVDMLTTRLQYECTLPPSGGCPLCKLRKAK